MSEEVEKAIEQLKKAAHENHLLFINSVRMLAAAIDAKDPYTRGHSERVARYSVAIGKSLNLPAKEMTNLRISALLHDVGKIGIDDRILRKPGALSDEEFEVMKGHPEKGAAIMSGVAQLIDIIPGMKYHHEKWSGGGYPDGLEAEQIPMQARIVAIADTFDAMTTNRPYQKAMELSYVVEKSKLRRNSIRPRVVDAFVRAWKNGEGRSKIKCEGPPDLSALLSLLLAAAAPTCRHSRTTPRREALFTCNVLPRHWRLRAGDSIAADGQEQGRVDLGRCQPSRGRAASGRRHTTCSR